jgi:hypothetical protein
VTFAYSGDAVHAAQTFTRRANFVREGTNTTLFVTDPTPQLGETVALSAWVTRWRGTLARGTVTFADNGVEIGRATVDATGFATLADVRLRLGGRRIVATFAPDPTESVIGSTSVPLVFAVGKAVPLLDAKLTEVAAGGRVVLEAYVRPEHGGSAIGTVSFYGGGVLVGTAAVDGRGVARMTATLPAGGPLAIRADYSGSSTVAAGQASFVWQGAQIPTVGNAGRPRRARRGAIRPDGPLVGDRAGRCGRRARDDRDPEVLRRNHPARNGRVGRDRLGPARRGSAQPRHPEHPGRLRGDERVPSRRINFRHRDGVEAGRRPSGSSGRRRRGRAAPPPPST